MTNEIPAESRSINHDNLHEQIVAVLRSAANEEWAPTYEETADRILTLFKTPFNFNDHNSRAAGVAELATILINFHSNASGVYYARGEDKGRFGWIILPNGRRFRIEVTEEVAHA